jgi:hypothetical protein
LKFEGLEEEWLSRGRLRLLVIAGMLIFGLAGSIRLVYYLGAIGDPASLETLLQERIA